MGGAAIVGGAALMFVPGGQLLGMGLISFGADVVIQKAMTGEVNWGEAALSGVIGVAGGGAGMVVGKVAAKIVTNPVVRAAAINGVDGAVSNAAGYVTSPGPHTAGGFIKQGLIGVATGGIPLKGANKVDLPGHPTSKLADLPPRPVLTIDSEKLPNIANNIESAIARGHPSTLSRITDTDTIRANRKLATQGFNGPDSPDEYPFASTAQGGLGAQILGVPIGEQRIQGGTISSFYQKNNIGSGDIFDVVIQRGDSPG